MKKLPTLITTLALSLSFAVSVQADPKPNVGDACDPKTFNASCNGNVLLDCINNVVKKIDCAKHGDGKAQICTEFLTQRDDSPYQARCLSEDYRCNQEDDIIVRKETFSTGKTAHKAYLCQKTTKGDLFLRLVRGSGKQSSELNKRFRIAMNGENSLESHDGEKCAPLDSLVQYCEETNSGAAFNVLYKCVKDDKGVLHQGGISTFHTDACNQEAARIAALHGGNPAEECASLC